MVHTFRDILGAEESLTKPANSGFAVELYIITCLVPCCFRIIKLIVPCSLNSSSTVSMY